jgi:outer membrane protein OmpA-like peptidoglycan-associated protein
MRFVLLLLMAICCSELRSQHIRDTLRLFFAINETESAINRARIDSLAKSLGDKVVAFWIFGYADFLNHDDYNKKLSITRANNVKAYVAKKLNSPHLSFVACEGKGESLSTDNGNKEGEAFQRRVDLIFEISGPKKEVNTRPVKIVRKPDSTKKKRKIEELSAGESVDIEGLSFQPGRHVLMKSSMPALRNLLKTLREHRNLKIAIQGHICCVEDDRDGLDIDTGERLLSVNRAKSVYEYLVKQGISPDRLEFSGFGHSQPKVTPETTPEEEQMNRRVEITILEK